MGRDGNGSGALHTRATRAVALCMKHSLSPFDALPQSKPVGQQQTGSGRMNRLELPHAWRGLRGRISLFCLVWACHKKDYKHKHVGFALKAPDGTV